MNLFFKPELFEHLLKCLGQCDASVRLRRTLASITDEASKRASYLPRPLQQYRGEKPAYDLGVQGVQSTLRRPDGSVMTMHPLQSVVVLGVPIDNAVLILM